MNVYEIPSPDEAGARRIAQAIYAGIRGAHAWGRRFPDLLGESALGALAAVPPRTMRRALLHAFGAARLDGRDAVEARDIRADEGMPRRRHPFRFAAPLRDLLSHNAGPRARAAVASLSHRHRMMAGKARAGAARLAARPGFSDSLSPGFGSADPRGGVMLRRCRRQSGHSP